MSKGWQAMGGTLTVLLLPVVIVAWLLFMPIQFGGRAAYVIVSGISMEPGLSRGDLVVLRHTADYEVGDVVTYREPGFAPIIHRIIAQEGSRYVLQGDNNTWIDSYRPTAEEIVGEMWFAIPGLGKVVEWLRSPPGMALLAGLTGVLLFMVRPQRDSRQTTRRRAAPRSPRLPGLGENFGDVLFLLALLALASAILGIIAFRQPVERSTTRTLDYEHVGAFSYWADVPAGLYDSNHLRTGEPIFPALVSEVHMIFDYWLASEAPRDVTLRYQLVAEVSERNGWKRTIVLEPGTVIPGSAFTTRHTFSLAEVDAVINRLEAATDFRGRPYTVALVPQVTVAGTLNGSLFEDTFAPRLEFTYDGTELWLSDPQLDDRGRIPVTQPGAVDITVEEPNTISLFGVLSPSIATLRWMAGAGLALSAAGVLFVLAAAWHGMRGGEEARIRFRAGSRVVAIRHNGLDAGGPLVEVASADDLVRLAREAGGPILLEDLAGVRRYFVQGERVTYYYELPDTRGAQQAIRPAATSGEGIHEN